MPRHPIIVEDCARALAQTSELWRELDGRRLFVTGGTGFFGTWLLELLTSAIDADNLDCEVLVLTRDPDAFASGPAAHIANHRSVRPLHGDVRTFVRPAGQFDYVVHFGSTGSKATQDQDPLGFFDLIVNGTRRVLDFAVASGARRLLLASTGAIYGGGLTGRVPESFMGAPDPLAPLSANAQAKRAAEYLAIATAQQHRQLKPVIARGFAFIGPYLPAHANFAAYDFIQDVLAGRPIRIAGDGTPVRSYLYGADLAVWLWTLLLRAPGGTAWNVGSEAPISIRELAEKIANTGPRNVDVRMMKTPTAGGAASWYVPSTKKAREQLGLGETVPLGESIRRTLAWYEAQPLHSSSTHKPKRAVAAM